MPTLQQTWPSETRLLIILACAGIALRLLCIGIFDYGIYSDAAEFRDIALNLIHGQGFSLENHPTAYRMPGYPLLLAAVYRIFNSTAAVKIVQVLIETATGIMIYLFTRKQIGSREAVLALGIWALLPVSILQPLTLMSEGLFTLLLVSLVTVMSGKRSRYTTIPAGLLCGAALLVKPFMLLFPALFGLNLYLQKAPRRKILHHTVLFTAVAAACLLPWVIRNQIALGAPVISTNGGQNLYIGNSPEATGTFFDIAADKYPAAADEVTIDLHLRQLAKSFIFSHPVAVLKTIPKKIAFLYSLESPAAIFLHGKGTIPAGMSFREAYRSTPLRMLLAVNIPYAILVLGAVFSFFLFTRSIKALRLPLLIILFWTGIHCIYFGTARFHYPLLPLFTIAAAVLPFRISAIRSGGRATVAAAITGILFCGLWGAEVVMVFFR